MSSQKQVLVGILGSALTVSGLSLALAPAPAQAVSGVFISEFHYDDSTTNDAGGIGEFVEITAAAGTDLTGWKVQLVNGNGNAVYRTDTLSGAVTDQADGWGTKVISYPTQAGGILQNGEPDGVALLNATGGVVEYFSYEGSMTTTLGTPPVSTPAVSTGDAFETNSTASDHSLQRQADGSWTGPAINGKGTPNGYDGGGSGELSATNEPSVDVTVDEPMAAVVLQATGGTPPYVWTTASELPVGVTFSPTGEITGTPTELGAFEILATVTDDEEASDSVTFTLTVEEAGALPSIADIQGEGPASQMDGDTVTTRGVVTAAYPTGGFNGFYIQTPGPDTTPNASDGIFVFGGSFDESTLEPGESVEVTGDVAEFNGHTEIEATSVTEIADLGDVQPKAVIPGTDCALPGTGCLTGAALEAAKEKSEGEAFQPTGDYTITDVYDGSPYNPPNAIASNHFGEVGLAGNSDIPLIGPTEIIDAQATAAIAARTAYNNAHRVILDDGSSTTYWNTANNAPGQDTPFPYFTPDHQVRVGAAVTFDQPVILDYRFGWKVQPVEQVIEEPTGLVTFEQDRPALPEDVGGDIKLATFNVLNYFTTLGEDVDGCLSFDDRDGNPIAIRPSCDPRGAWDDENFARQEAKTVNAINALDADVISLEEVENSLVVDGHARDEALSALVDALNDDAGAGTWTFVPSPASASLAGNIAEQDVIRQGLIYKPATVEPVGGADMLFDDPAFENAREPFAAVFKPLGGTDEDEFLVIANHFKSKGSGPNDGTGQGNSNPDRVAQAGALAEYAEDLAAARGVEAVFLTGDFNAYSMEDPMQVLEGEGYENVAPDDEWSYNFDGQVGSLDHVLANETAAAQVTGVDIWEINSNETVFNQYSRYNYNAAQLYSPEPFSTSDHNPEIVGISFGEQAPSTVTGTDVSVDYGQGTTMHVTVEAAGEVPTGTVTLKVGDEVLGTGTLVDGSTEAKINRNRVGPGVHTVTIEYSGDASVAPGQGTATLTVDKATPTVIGTRTVVEYGSATTMAVHVGATGVVPTGQVVLKVGDVRLGSGTLTEGSTAATIGAKKLPPGTYEVTIRYDGDGFVETATGTATLVVKKATSTVVAPNTSMTFGQTGSLLVKVKAIGVVPTGTVRVFSAEGLALSAATTLVNGEATVTLTANKLPADPTPYTVTIKYSGDDFVKPGTDTSTLRVKN